MSDADRVPRVLRAALRTWPRAWRDRYAAEMIETWQAGGARNRDTVEIAWRGLQHRVLRPRPASERVATVTGPAPEGDVEPRRWGRVWAAAVITLIGVFVVQIAAGVAADTAAMEAMMWEQTAAMLMPLGTAVAAGVASRRRRSPSGSGSWPAASPHWP
jgi:hypothetical protein